MESLKLALLRPCCRSDLLTSLSCGAVGNGCCCLFGHSGPSTFDPSRGLRVFGKAEWIQRIAPGVRARHEHTGALPLADARVSHSGLPLPPEWCWLCLSHRSGATRLSYRRSKGREECALAKLCHQMCPLAAFSSSFPSAMFPEGRRCLHGRLRRELNCLRVRGTRRGRY